MTDQTYNGWANRATWLVVLHLNNDHALQLEALELATRSYGEAIGNVPMILEDEPAERADRYAVSIVADDFRAWVEHFTYRDADHTDPYGLLAGDLIGTALAYVDWTEVAEAFLEDVERVHDGFEATNPR